MIMKLNAAKKKKKNLGRKDNYLSTENAKERVLYFKSVLPRVL